VKCRFCGEWLDPSQRPALSGPDVAALTQQIAGEVARQVASQVGLQAVAPESEEQPSSPPTSASRSAAPRRRSSTRDIPSDPHAAGVIAPDTAGRAAGSVVFDPRSNMQPSVAPAYEAPGPFPGLMDPRTEALGEQARVLGQPAPRGARWQPGGEEGPSWEPPATEELAHAVEAGPPPPTTSDAVWQAPAWLRTDEPAAPKPQPAEPTWAPPAFEQLERQPERQQPAASQAPVWTAPNTVESPVWNPAPDPRPRPRIPELSLEPATPPGPAVNPASFGAGLAEIGDDEFDDGPAVEPVAAKPKSRKPKPTVEPKPDPAPVAARPQPTSPDLDDDDDDDDFDDDDDDDDFDDDEDESHSSMSMGDLGGISFAEMNVPARPRKLPWVPIAAVAGALVLVFGFMFRDTLLGNGSDDANTDELSDTEASVDEAEQAPPEPPPPDLAPVEVEPPPPAIDPAVLDEQIAQATSLVDKKKQTDARVILDAILEKMPDEPRALALLSLIHLDKGSYDDALATANRCVDADAEQALCWIAIGVVEQENKNLGRALEGYRKYLELAPKGRFAKSAKSEAQRLAARLEG
jgi:hypothetical protein